MKHKKKYIFLQKKRIGTKKINKAKLKIAIFVC